ncbi:hypothetical protein [Janthinobacterium sp. RB2R34]|uniref:hypothetical protein n=1 Tax=Janthinobacterium sp. RB2R34 TaxID=3424193 RepID=UPI003F22C4A9
MMEKTTLTIQNPRQLDAGAIGAAIVAGRQVLVQFDTLGEPAPLLPELDALAASHGAALTVRIYGYDPRVFDARILRALPHVASLSIDCHRNALHLETLGELHHLKRLSLGVHALAQTDILQLENLHGLEYLQLGESAKNNIDLAPLRHYTQLSSLSIEGHATRIEMLASLPALTQLSLYRMKNKVALDFMSGIARLEQLRLQLGGRESISEIDAPKLSSLEVIRVRGMAELGDLGRFPLLRQLWVEDQIKLAQLNVAGNGLLEQLHLLTCKGLVQLTGLSTLRTLRQLIVSETGLDIDALRAQGLPASLTHMRFRTGKIKRDEEIAAQLAQAGYTSERLPF